MRRYSVFYLSLIVWLLSACKGLLSPPSTPTDPVSSNPSPATLQEADASADPNSGPSTGCFYAWSTRELPDLGAELGKLVAESGQQWHVSAYAFGEECRSDLGEITFLPMETDFRIQALVDSLENEDALGSIMHVAMAAIEALPDEQIAGTRPGRVEFEFRAGASQSLRLNMDIGKFREEAGGLRGAALFRHFDAAP